MPETCGLPPDYTTLQHRRQHSLYLRIKYSKIQNNTNITLNYVRSSVNAIKDQHMVNQLLRGQCVGEWFMIYLIFQPLLGLLHEKCITVTYECKAFGEIRHWQNNPSTQRKPVPVLLCPPYIPYMTWPESNILCCSGKIGTNHLIYDKLQDHHYIVMTGIWVSVFNYVFRSL